MPKSKPTQAAAKPANTEPAPTEALVPGQPPPIDAATYPARIDELFTSFKTPISAASQTWLQSQVKEAKARDEGAQIASPAVLDAVIETTHIAGESLLAGKVLGYGPLRYRYCLDLARLLADKVAHFDASLVGAAGGSAAKGASLRESRDDRRSALRALKNLTANDDEAKARLKKVRDRNERPDERAQSLQGLSRELQAVTAGIPAELVKDAGVTPALSTRLNSYAHAVVSAHDTSHEERASLAAQYDAMNVLDGRILHELRALAGAMRDARKVDKSVPVLKIAVLRNGRPKKAKVATPVKPPTG
jgi:hypothetical protein